MGIDSTIQSLQYSMQSILSALNMQTTELNRICNALERIAAVAEERRPTVVWKITDDKN